MLLPPPTAALLAQAVAPIYDPLTTGPLAVAWLALAAWLAARAPQLADRHRADALAAAGLGAAALAVHLALPAGPLHALEGARMEVLWRADPRFAPTFGSITVLAWLLHAGGVPASVLVRGLGAALGAAAVSLTYLCGRAAGLGRGAAALAAAVLLAWPAHARFAPSLGASVEGPALWLAAFAAALAPAAVLGPRERVAVVAAATVLGVYARPEYRLLGLALLPALAHGTWSWRQRGALAALGTLGLAGYARYVPASGVDRSDMSRWFVPWALRDASVGAPWWLAAGVLGLAAGRLRPQARAALGLSVAALAGTYWFLASEYNPMWGQWRYYVSLTPFLALGAGALADRAPTGRWREPGLWAAAAATALSLGLWWPALRRVTDLQAEYAFVRATAPAVVRARPAVLVLTGAAVGGGYVAAEATPLLALGVAVGPVGAPRPCGDTPPRTPVDVRDLEDWVAGCAGALDLAHTVVYLGVFRPAERLAAVHARFDLVPLVERVTAAAPTAPVINTACPAAPDALVGAALPPCRETLGWYQLVPR